MAENNDVYYVAPLTSVNDVDAVRSVLLSAETAKSASDIDLRNRVLFDVGFFSGISASKLLTLRVRDVDNGMVNVHYKIGNSDHVVHRRFDNDVYFELHEYIVRFSLTSDDWLFPFNADDLDHHLARADADIIIYRAGLACGFEHLGLDTMQKTYGRMWYEQGKNINILCWYFNQASCEETLRYIGVDPNSLGYNNPFARFDPHNVK